MEATFLRLAEPILGKGVLGLVVLALAWVVLRLYRENSILHDRLLDEKEKRIQTTADATAAVQASSRELKENSALLLSMMRSLPARRNSTSD